MCDVQFQESHIVEIEKRGVNQTTFQHGDGNSCIQLSDIGSGEKWEPTT